MRKLATLTTLLTLSVLLALMSFPTAVAAETPEADDEVSNEAGNPQFMMRALDSENDYITIDAEPGERYAMNFEIRNTGDAEGIAILYATDAYTLNNGGFGARRIEAERTGPTTWLDFESEEFELEPDQRIIETVAIDIPDDIEAGEHLTSVVVQNRDPIAITEDGSGVHLDQVSRQAIAILINIEGEHEYGLEIGEAEHHMAGRNSTGWIEVNNTGNAMLRPDSGEFRMEDESGFEMLRQDASMDVIYAGHETHYIVNFGERLEPGDYYVWLDLEDGVREVSASGERLLLHVEEPPLPPEREEDGGMAGLMQPPRMPGDDGSGSWLTLIGLIAAISFLAALMGVLLGRRRRGQASEGAVTANPIEPDPEPESHLNRAAQATVVEARQSASRPAPGARRVKPLRPSGQSE